MSKFNDFSALKSLKKEMAGKSDASETPTDRQRRSKTVTHKSKDTIQGEQAAKERGLVAGSTVTLMDSNDKGILRHIYKDHVEIEIDGLLFPAGFGDFIVNNPDEDRRLLGSVSSRSASRKTRPETKSEAPPKELELDLHIDKIPSGYDAPEGFELPYQIEYFKATLRKHLKHRGMRITVIHGVGDGTLRDAIRKELDEVFPLSCTWTPGPLGVTVVDIK